MTDTQPSRFRRAIKSLHGWLNAIGSLLLAYALANPSAFAEARALLPAPIQPYAPALALGWFLLVQAAKMSAIKKAQEKAA